MFHVRAKVCTKANTVHTDGIYIKEKYCLNAKM